MVNTAAEMAGLNADEHLVVEYHLVGRVADGPVDVLELQQHRPVGPDQDLHHLFQVKVVQNLLQTRTEYSEELHPQ